LEIYCDDHSLISIWVEMILNTRFYPSACFKWDELIAIWVDPNGWSLTIGPNVELKSKLDWTTGSIHLLVTKWDEHKYTYNSNWRWSK